MDQYDEKHVSFDDCVCKRDSEKAILVDGPELPPQIWIPKSQIHEDSEVFERDTEGKLIVTLWLAKEKGLV